ncbi:6,7-dimethyl-8-ribityllumazine synthase [Salsipaludibacter albus]|uniref:6,7-dimethyl-8-ribityllumazine synthase n=1 Tax=Salsipaludibacter albus TaxID=2849650 RepID=UPI001EE487BC|nr:6,7-dimethyl-8-ribityllumazine synthase [Salsipaludibacter albus]MBY5163776.1 6,7-dimethyl-8-ribityllumazine synthase [Salsipaludibacter albus]
MSTRAPDVLGDLDATGLSIPIVASRFNAEVVDVLVDGALERLVELGADPDACPVVRVPGAFELPVVVARLAARPDVDGVVALGAVVRGGTPHFDYVCQAATTGLEAVARDHDTPIGFGLLTTDTWEQATDRAGGAHGNKGREAAEAVVETVRVLHAA